MNIFSTILILNLFTLIPGYAQDIHPAGFPSPNGFVPADSLRIFGTPEKPAKDGSVFDYIDGGGMIYLSHGMKIVTHQMFADRSHHMITVDLYDMGTPENAQAIFSDESICPRDYLQGQIGVPCKTYSYSPDYFLYAVKGNYLVNISTAPDSLRTIVNTYAKEFIATLSGE